MYLLQTIRFLNIWTKGFKDVNKGDIVDEFYFNVEDSSI